MKRTLLYLGICLLILSTQPISARHGCMQKSLELAEKYDPHEYHYVACNCSCEKEHKILPDGTCYQCKHRHKEIFINQVHTDPSKLINIARLKTFSLQNKAATSVVIAE